MFHKRIDWGLADEARSSMAAALIRLVEERDIPGIIQLQLDAYPVMSQVATWSPEHLTNHRVVFSQGQYVAEREGRIVGHCANLIARSQVALQAHTYAAITGRGSFNTHDPKGDTLYGAEVMVHPDERQQGIGRQLYEQRFQLCRQLRLRYFVSGGRLPGYAEYKDDMSIEKYVASVLRGEITDRTLSAQLAVGLTVRSILPGYINDPSSSNYATLLAWENPDLSKASAPGLVPEAVGSSPKALEEALRPKSPSPPSAAW